jgi:PEP-CTERM motif
VGLWALDFGNGTTGLADTLYFTSGINDQKDGLFGSITNVPEPSTWALMVAGFGSLVLLAVRRRQLSTPSPV